MDKHFIQAWFQSGTRFVMLDDNGSELYLAHAYFKQAGLQNALHLESAPENLTRRVVELCDKGVSPGDIVVLLDIRMPRMNGFELIYELRNNIATYGVRIIMLSASNRSADRDNAAEIGADGYIVKPFSIEKLAAVMAA